jgi:hypothetical protein|tara:strand:+ start:859 stop:1869 length:1011 start_codon:yes stop_codon:yes gene_type:complete
LKYYDTKLLRAQGLAESSLARGYPFQRLPQKYKKSVRKEIWELSENSAGVNISFFSDTTEIVVKWSLKHDLKMNHMTDAGIKGVDLYQKNNGTWHYISTGLPNGKENEQTLLKGASKTSREYCLYLPLYDTITNLQLGLDDGCTFEDTINKNQPIVFYGTSITQGGCASRPGLAHTNIISRKLDHECINLGFSGNGILENSVGSIMSNINSSLYIIECMYNVDKDMVINNTIPLIKTIRKNPEAQKTPIIFIEQCIIDLDSIHKEFINSVIEKNDELNKQVDNAINKGEKDLFIIKQIGGIDEDSEATVDGIHFNDLGFQRYANHLINNIFELNIL